ncbi:sporulation protein [Nocardiopsis baichengensis]|uniref:sporulation protein n=1 Tax=Nocardiopsis baichengensis TaxID=280240 RepID=UPI000347F54B|nr:sporulation protein [Nocardiopsis baichengensis]
MVGRVLAQLGVVDPVKVSLIPDTLDVRPGGEVQGRIELVGGQAKARVRALHLCLATRAWDWDAESGWRLAHERWGTLQVDGGFTLAPRERRTVPFMYRLPLQAQLTRAWGEKLPRSGFGLVARAIIAWARDSEDRAELAVHPLPVQQAVLDALRGLGLYPTGGECWHGRLDRRYQESDVYQVIEVEPGPESAVRAKAAELSFLSGPDGTLVHLKVYRGRLLPGRREVFRLSHPGGAPIAARTAQRVADRVRAWIA